MPSRKGATWQEHDGEAVPLLDCHGLDLLVVSPAFKALDDSILYQRCHALSYHHLEEIGHRRPRVDEASYVLRGD